jgi:hypothetical protein
LEFSISNHRVDVSHVTNTSELKIDEFLADKKYEEFCNSKFLTKEIQVAYRPNTGYNDHFGFEIADNHWLG